MRVQKLALPVMQVHSCPILQVSMVVTNRFVPLPVVYEHERFLVESLSLSGMYHVIARSVRCMHKLLRAHWHGDLPGWLPLPCCFEGPSQSSHACLGWWLLAPQQHCMSPSSPKVGAVLPGLHCWRLA